MAWGTDKVCEEYVPTKDEIEIDQLKAEIALLKMQYNGSVCLKPGKVINNDIHSGLRAAFVSYSGPQLMITSLKRGFNKGSQHFHGKASDFELDFRVVKYFESLEGRNWLSENKLTYIIEFPNESSHYFRWKGRYEKVIKNVKATAPHIHLQIKRDA